MTTYGRFLEVPEVARMKSLLLWFVIYVYVRPGVVAEIELYPDVTDDYSLDQLSYYMRSQQRRQALLEQRQQQLAEAEEAFGRDELEAAAEAAAVVAAAEARGGGGGVGGGDGPASQKLRLPFERPWSGVPSQPSGRGQLPVRQQGMAMVPDALEGFHLGASVRQEVPAFSYERTGQAADGEAAPFAYSPKDLRFYEDSPSQVSELAGGDAFRSRDYGFRGGEDAAGVSDVDAAPAPVENNVWPERSSGLVQQPAQPAVQLAQVPQSSAQQPDQRQRGGSKAEGSSGSGPTSGAKKTGVEPMAAAAGDSLGLGHQQQQSPGAAIPSRVMDRDAPSHSAGAGVPPSGPEIGNVGGGSPASDVAARAQAGADAAANAYQSARGHKVVLENEDEEGEAVQFPNIQSDFMSGQIKQKHMSVNSSDVYFIAIVAGCCAAAAVGIVGVGISWYRRKHRDNRDQEGGLRWGDQRKVPTNVHYQRGSANAFKAMPINYMQTTSSGEMSHSDGRYNTMRLQKNAKAAADAEYPAYGVTGPKQDISPTSGDRRLAQSAQMYHYQHQKQQIIAMERPRPMPVAHKRGFSDQMFRDYERREDPRSKEDEPGDVPWEMHPGTQPRGEEIGVSASEEEQSSEERRRIRAAKEDDRLGHKASSLDRKASYDRTPTGTPTRSSVAIATQKLDSVRGSAQMRRIIKGMNYAPKPRSSSLPDEIQRLSRTYSVPTRTNEMKDHELTPEESKRKSMEIQRTIRKTMPAATQRLEDSTRRAVEYLEERHKTSLAGTESKVRRPQPPEPLKPQERITRRRRPTTPAQK